MDCALVFAVVLLDAWGSPEDCRGLREETFFDSNSWSGRLNPLWQLREGSGSKSALLVSDVDCGVL